MGKITDLSELVNANNKLCFRSSKIIFVMLLNILFSFIPYLLAVWAYIKYFQSSISLIGLSILVLIIAMYSRAFFSAVQSRLVANIVWEEKPKLWDAFKRTFNNMGSVAVYSIMTLIIGLLGQSINRGKNHFLKNFFKKNYEGIPEPMWETTTHLALPEMMERKEGFSSAMNEVKKGVKYFSSITFKSLSLDYYIYLLVIIGLVVSIIILVFTYTALAVMVFMAILLMIFLKQSYIKTTYYTVLYVWLSEQIKRKKKKKKIETRIPEILENSIIVQ